MTGRKQRGRGRGRGDRGGRGSSRGGSGGGRGGDGRGRGLGYGTRHEIDGDYEPFPFHPRDNSWCGSPPPNARGYKRAGKGRGFGVDRELDYSDSLDKSDYYYYDSSYSTPVRGASPSPSSSRGHGHQRGRGRWRIDGLEVDSLEPKDRLRKRHLESKLRSGNASLSQLLYEDRPFLKPIAFVQSKQTPTLFLREEEILKPVAEEAGEQEASHVPTAERVYRIFHGGSAAPKPSESLSDEEELLEIDYVDLGRVMSEFEAAAASSKKTTTLVAATAATSISTSVQKDASQSVVTPAEEETTGFYIDTKPSPVQDSSTSTNHIAVEHHCTGILGEDIGDDEDDDIIVYVAPHPRNGKLASAHTQSSPPDANTLPPTPVYQKVYDTPHAPAAPPEPEPKLWPEAGPKDVVFPEPSPVPAPALAFKDFSFSLLSNSPKPTHRVRWPRRTAHRKAERNAMFGSFGAIRAEATLRELDPRRAEQRRGDSDVDWGGSTSAATEAEDSEEDGGMLVDQDIEVSAMAAFVRSTGVGGQAHLSAGDLEDEARIRMEDEEENGSASSSDGRASGEDVDTELELADGVQGILTAEGEDEDEVASRSFSAEDDDDNDDDDASEDEEATPKRSFQARLDRIRSRTAGQPIKDMMRGELNQEWEPDDDSDSDSDIGGEDSIIAGIQDFLDENDDILRAMGRKQRNRTFQAIRNGEFEVFIDSSPKRKKDKYVSAELRDQWERDRAKKAERRRLRELERIASAGVDTTTTKKKNKNKNKNKKAHKAGQAAAPSLETVAGHIRSFVEDLGAAPTLSLPPMEPHVRKLVHELAHAFKLKSKSEGNGAARFTTLVKTTLSGVQVDERKVAWILGRPPPPPPDGGNGKGKGKAGPGVKIRPRDGELVGAAAPKIDGSNVGFQMLSAMGWAEGSRIGVVGGGGLDAPLVAVIKTTKLGLGASSHTGRG